MVWAIAREYMGNDRPPTSTAAMKRPAIDPMLIMITASTAKVAAAKVTTVMIRRRSKRSDSPPIGHWKRMPPRIMTLMKIEIWPTVKPARSAKTAPMPKSMPWARPVPPAPKTPRGDRRYSSTRPTGRAAAKAGAAPAVREIGIKAIETRTEARTKSSKPLGAARLSSNWPPALPDSTTTM